MAEYVTVVSVENGHDHSNKKNISRHLDDHSKNSTNAVQKNDHSTNNNDSQFITVLSIGNGENMVPVLNSIQMEEVIVYRLPGERLGFGLKFQGGTRSAENIQRLFIQSCASDSPASRAQSSWGHLQEGDEILEIDGIDVQNMTRLECVKCLKESNLAIRLMVRNGEGKAYDVSSKENVDFKGDKKTTPPPPPPVPPRKINKRKSQEKLAIESHAKVLVNDKPLTPPPESEYYLNLFSGKFHLQIFFKGFYKNFFFNFQKKLNSNYVIRSQTIQAAQYRQLLIIFPLILPQTYQ